MMKASKIKDNLSKISKKAIGSNDPLNEQNPSKLCKISGGPKSAVFTVVAVAKSMGLTVGN